MEKRQLCCEHVQAIACNYDRICVVPDFFRKRSGIFFHISRLASRSIALTLVLPRGITVTPYSFFPIALKPLNILPNAFK